MKNGNLEISKFAKTRAEKSSRLVWLKSSQLPWRAIWWQIGCIVSTHKASWCFMSIRDASWVWKPMMHRKEIISILVAGGYSRKCLQSNRIPSPVLWGSLFSRISCPSKIKYWFSHGFVMVFHGLCMVFHGFGTKNTTLALRLTGVGKLVFCYQKH